MIVVWILVGLVGLFVLISILGRILPGDFAATVETTLPHAPQAVWDAIADFKRHPLAGGMARGVEVEEPDEGTNGPQWVEDIGSSNVRIRTKSADAPTALVRTMEDLVVPMTATWTYTLTPDGEGTRLKLESKTRVDLGTWHAPIFRVLIRLFNGVEKGVRHYVARLKQSLEKASHP